MRCAAVALGLILVACTGAPAVLETPSPSSASLAPQTPTPAAPTLVPLPTRSQTPGECMAAQAFGELVAHTQWGIALAVENEGSVVRVVWPHGYASRWEGDRLALVDGSGTVLAHAGDRVEVGGGYVAGSWYACSYVTVLAPVESPPDPQPTRHTPAPTSSSTSTLFDCGGPPLPPGEPALPGPIPRLVDETGLVVSCIQSNTVTDLVGTISLSNPSEPNAVHVMWERAPCDAGIVFTFRHATDGFELIGERPRECARPNGPLPLYITFNRPMPAADVAASLRPWAGAEGVFIPLRTADRPTAQGDICRGGRTGGTLVGHDEWGLALRRTTNETTDVVWPYGWAGYRDATGLELIDHEGATVAAAGDVVTLAGGYLADDSWGVCGPVEVLEPASTDPSASPAPRFTVVDDVWGAITQRIEALVGADGCLHEAEISVARPWPVEQIEQEAAEHPGGVGVVLPRDAVYVGDPQDAALAFGAIEVLYDGRDWAFIAPIGDQEWLTGFPLEPGEWIGAPMAQIELSNGRSGWAAGYYSFTIGSHDDCPE